MKLEDAFLGTLNSPGRGLFLHLKKMQEQCEAIQKAVESGDLQALKVTLMDGHEVVRNLDVFFTSTEGKAVNLTTDETGGIIDLSIPPQRRN